MPGTIRVTVLELVDIPGPGARKYAMKVSVGDRSSVTPPGMSSSSGPGVSSLKAFNADFAFSVLNLLDPVVFTLLDAHEVPVGRATLPIPAVVEKGFRDEFLALSNGGRVRVKSSFVLSEEERAKIAAMRASSLRKRVTPLRVSDAPSSDINSSASSSLQSPLNSEPPTPSPAPAFSTQPEVVLSPSVLVPSSEAEQSEEDHESVDEEMEMEEKNAGQVISEKKVEERAELLQPGIDNGVENVESADGKKKEEAGDAEEAGKESAVESGEDFKLTAVETMATRLNDVESTDEINQRTKDTVSDGEEEWVAEKLAVKEPKHVQEEIDSSKEEGASLDKMPQIPGVGALVPSSSSKVTSSIIDSVKRFEIDIVEPDVQVDKGIVQPEDETRDNEELAESVVSESSVIKEAVAVTQVTEATKLSVENEARVTQTLAESQSAQGIVGSLREAEEVEEEIPAVETIKTSMDVPSLYPTAASFTDYGMDSIKAGGAVNGEYQGSDAGSEGATEHEGNGNGRERKGGVLSGLMKQVLGAGVIFASIAVLWPRSQQQSRVQVKRDGEGRVYVVKPGDVLSQIIPRDEYCNPKSKFFQLNPDVCNVDRIYEGQKLRLF